MPRCLFSRIVFLLLVIAGGPSLSSSIGSTNHHVVLITIDGLPAYMLDDPQAPLPTLRQLAREGVRASQGMRVSNPSVTWPSHTTLVTGVQPDQHGVLYNGMLVRGAANQAVRIDGLKDKADLVAVPTVYDILHAKGYHTAGVNWPCTRNSGTLHDDFPDTPNQIEFTTPRLRTELIEAGMLVDETQKSFAPGSGAQKDQIWTHTAVHLIEKRRPNFMLFHMLICDSTHHKYGAQSPASYAAVALADAQLREVLRAVERAGIKDQTTIFVVADHGFEKALKIVNPNVLLRKAGLLEAGRTPTLMRARVQSVSEGGIAMVYLNNPDTAQADRAKALEALQGAEGIGEVIMPERYAEFGFPAPEKNRQMADFVLSAKPGYAFGNVAHGDELITEVTMASGNQGHHGYLSTNPKMNAIFVASGRGIKKGATIETVRNEQVAPTIAHLFGQKLEQSAAKPLLEILE